jgi:hypothetical protein
MGTTLTGTTPQDTYDSLIKVTDNGPISGTLKALSDGLGNDSTLSLSTTAASIAGTLAVTGAATIASTLAVTNAVTAGNNTNVQATSTNTRLLVTAVGVANTILGFNNSGSTQNGVVNNAGYVGILQDYPLVVTIADGEKMRITGTGNVGIGTSNPVDGKLCVVGTTALGNAITQTFAGVAAASTRVTADGRYAIGVDAAAGATERVSVTVNGLTFNGDTAAANALDDYEEGTWTMGVSFGGAASGVTYQANTGTYTKIGRQVTVNGVVVLTSKGSSTGSALLTGLPFTINSNDAFYVAATLRMENVSFANQFQAYGGIGSTVVAIDEITEAGVNGSLTNADFANNSTVMICLTYFV